MLYSLGIDLGTSSVKVTAIDIKGDIAAQSSANYQIIHPGPDRAEQDPVIWWQKTQKALKEVIEILKNKDQSNIEIMAIGVAGQMHGLIALDNDGKVIIPAIIWADNRTQKEVQKIKKTLTKKQKKRLANPIVTNFTAPKMLWLKENQPESWEKIEKIMLPKDYIVYCLTGNIVTDESDTSGTLLFNIEQKDWDWDVIDALKFRKETLPEVLEPGEKAGKLRKSLANKLDLSQSTVVVIAGGDAPVSALASGVKDENTAGISLGTAGQIILPSKTFKVDPEGRLHTMAFIRPGWWFLMGALLSAGYNLSWWFENIKKERKSVNDNLNVLEEEISTLVPGSEGLVYLPYLLGERSPLNDPLASGCFFGLQAFHQEVHIIKAIMEGVAYAFRWNLEIAKELNIAPEKIFLSGGGSKSYTWAQIIADVLKLPAYQSKTSYDPAYGAAILAAESTGMISNINDVLERNIKKYRVFYPRNDIGVIYDDIYLLYKKLYQDNKEKMWELAELRKAAKEKSIDMETQEN